MNALRKYELGRSNRSFFTRTELTKMFIYRKGECVALLRTWNQTPLFAEDISTGCAYYCHAGKNSRGELHEVNRVNIRLFAVKMKGRGGKKRKANLAARLRGR